MRSSGVISAAGNTFVFALSFRGSAPRLLPQPVFAD